ncbi:hypothetical protein [Actinocorallia aurantiaca]|uniref:Uncharacterized protein n=1 Tax=Actinocorallia aurantiaca TaxID=46204 RepID=A0ABN3U932_9ACTN
MRLREKISVRGPDGRVESWSVVRHFGESGWYVELSDTRGRSWSGIDAGVFDAFRDLRQVPEAEGCLFLVAGARLDCWPTRMQSQMGGGNLVAAHLGPWKMVTGNLLTFILPSFQHKAFFHDVFSPAPASKVGTVEEQDAYRKQWIDRATRAS